MTTSDPTPDVAMETALDGWQRERNCDDIRHVKAAGERLAAALRTEQSARQELLESHQQAWNNAALWKEDRDALQQRIDAALALLDQLIWNEEDLGAVAFVHAALTTESKEPAPRLDPEPWTCIHCDKRGKEEYMIDRENRRFLPRPEFSQNPADYRIEAPHE